MVNIFALKGWVRVAPAIACFSCLLTPAAQATTPNVLLQSLSERQSQTFLPTTRFESAPLLVANSQVPESTMPLAEAVNGESSDTTTLLANIEAASQITDPFAEVEANDEFMPQVTSVSQLTDVRPTDWAFQALQSLVERYGCIVGYPDRTFRGNRALTRYEFAAGLNACMDRINELIAAATADLAKKEDLLVLQRLQEEFAAELATLRGKVDALEVRTTTLEAQQFSTTTKLTGLLWMNLTGAFPDGDILAERSLAQGGNNVNLAPTRNPVTLQPSRVLRDKPQPTFGYYTWLTFNTSFTGKDLLITQLASGNSRSPANELVSAGFFNSWGTPITDQTGTLASSVVTVREMSYAFPVGDKVRVVVGPRVNTYRYFDGNRFTNFLTGAGSFNASGSTLFSAVDRGSGAVVIWNINPQFRFTAGYLAENTEFLNPAIFNTSSSPSNGLFRATNVMSAELAYSPSRNFNLRLLYARSDIKPYNGFIGGAVGEPLPYGFADDGFRGRVRDGVSDTFIVDHERLWCVWALFLRQHQH